MVGHRYNDTVEGVLILAVLAHVTWSLHRGCGTYLRMPHSAAMAIAAQGIATLAAGTFLLAVFSGFGAEFFFELLELFRLR